jgi:general secretion pathway protein C
LFEVLFKKHFWVITVLMTALLALITALIINAMIAGQIRAQRPLASGSIRSMSVGDPTASIRTGDPLLSESLTNERMFNADPPPVSEFDLASNEESNEEEGEGEEDKDEALKDGEGCKHNITDLNINLLGTLVAESPEESLATAKVSGETKFARVGLDIDEGVKVINIARTYIVIERDDSYECVLLWGEKKATSSRPSRLGSSSSGRGRYQSPTARPPRSKASARSRAQKKKEAKNSKRKDYSRGVAKVGDWNYKIDRAMLDEELSDMTQLTQGAKVVPNIVGGKYRGFRLVGVRSNSLYRAIGLQSGDSIRRVNGIEIDSPTKALQLFEQLRNSNNITVDIDRRGQPKSLDYTVQ